MVCEYCNKNHDGNYGSGRFCSERCARGYSTKSKRRVINRKVSEKLKGRSWGRPFVKGDERHKVNKSIRSERAKKGYENSSMLQRIRNEKREDFKSGSWELLIEKYTSNGKLNPYLKRRFSEDKEHICDLCKRSEWLGRRIILEIHHKDGIIFNNDKQNLELLCSNCHNSQHFYIDINNIKRRFISSLEGVFRNELKKKDNDRGPLTAEDNDTGP